MRIVARICQWVAGKMNKHVIWDRGESSDEYLVRYHTEEDFRDNRVFLHNIKLPDNEVPHNHPYEWQLSIILSASYTEEYFDPEECPLRGIPFPIQDVTLKTRRVRWFNWIPNSRYHRIKELHGDVWTIFIHGPKHGDSWYFWFPGIGRVHNSKLKETQEHLDREYWAQKMEPTRYA